MIVITGATEEHGTFPLYRQQLADAGIPLIVADISDKPNLNGGGNLGFRVDFFRRMAEMRHDEDFIIFSDAFDVTFYGDYESVRSRIPTTYLLHASEKNCYPDMSIAEKIQNPSPWRFANGGLVAGTPAQYMRWCYEAERHPRFNRLMLDQQFLNILVAEGSELCALDCRTELFFCIFGGYDELQFENGKPINTTYDTRPAFLHANGKWTAEEMFDRQRRSLK